MELLKLAVLPYARQCTMYYARDVLDPPDESLRATLNLADILQPHDPHNTVLTLAAASKGRVINPPLEAAGPSYRRHRRSRDSDVDCLSSLKYSTVLTLACVAMNVDVGAVEPAEGEAHQQGKTLLATDSTPVLAKGAAVLKLAGATEARLQRPRR